jgi:hypothetical protein
MDPGTLDEKDDLSVDRKSGTTVETCSTKEPEYLPDENNIPDCKAIGEFTKPEASRETSINRPLMFSTPLPDSQQASVEVQTDFIAAEELRNPEVAQEIVTSHTAIAPEITPLQQCLLRTSAVPPEGFYKVIDMYPDSFHKLRPEWKAGKFIFFRSFKSVNMPRKALCRYCGVSFEVVEKSLLTNHVLLCSNIPLALQRLYCSTVKTVV